jgi:hypothetical protein
MRIPEKSHGHYRPFKKKSAKVAGLFKKYPAKSPVFLGKMRA